MIDFPENQKTVSAWCEIFPPKRGTWHELHHRMVRLLEEVTELAVAVGMSQERLIEVVGICYEKSRKDFGRREEIPGEAADVLIALMCLATRHGFDLQATLDARMQRNRSRPASYYARKQREKKELGL